VVRSLGTVVHECGHALDIGLGQWQRSIYVIDRETRFDCPVVGRALARNRITDDVWDGRVDDAMYRNVYLTGDPDDMTMDPGDQGFDTLLEELLQYVNALALEWAMRDRLGDARVSARDGVLAFLWYTMRYLHLARTEWPDVHAEILAEPCVREALLTMWGRAWTYLDLSSGIRGLGLRDDRLYPLATDPVLLAEIQRVREAHGCPVR
jgi:hypothetical protein